MTNRPQKIGIRKESVNGTAIPWRKYESDASRERRTIIWISILSIYSMLIQMIASALQYWSYWPLVVFPLIAGLIAIMTYMQRMRFPPKP